MTDLTARRREAEGEPEGALVLIHGRGADENDLFPVLDYLDPERRFLGVTPRGPLSLPPGGAHWYMVREIGYPDRETFLHSYAAHGGPVSLSDRSFIVPFIRYDIRTDIREAAALAEAGIASDPGYVERLNAAFANLATVTL